MRSTIERFPKEKCQSLTYFWYYRILIFMQGRLEKVERTPENSGVMPVVDGPWKGTGIANMLPTFEVYDDDSEEFACLLSGPAEGRIRYYLQTCGEGWVWSINVPENSAVLIAEEHKEIERLIG